MLYQKSRKAHANGALSHVTRGGTGLDAIDDLETRRALQAGVESVAGAARFAIAAAADMLAGKLTPQEASVINSAASRVLKAAELHLKFARGANKELRLPPS